MWVIVEIREKALGAIRFLPNAALTGFAAGVLVILFGLMVAKAAEPVPVKVGAYEYGVVYFYENGQPKGMVPHLISLLNDMQDEYVFELAETSSRRRYWAVMSGEVDLVLLESSNWDWHELNVRFSDTIVREQGVYLALAGRDDAEMLFEDVIRYPILCVLGFHYGFADFNADPEYLRQNYDVLLRYNEKDVLAGLLSGEAPIGVVSAGFLATQVIENPDLRDAIVIADQPDATHDLVSVFSDSSSISPERLNQLIAKLRTTGELERMWQQHHLGLSG